MRVLVDSSTLYSALTHRGRTREVLDGIMAKHEVVLSDYIVEEVERNLTSQLPTPKPVLEAFRRLLAEVEVVDRDRYGHLVPRATGIVERKDAPVLACALLEEVDALLTSDKGFKDVQDPDALVVFPWTAEATLL